VQWKEQRPPARLLPALLPASQVQGHTAAQYQSWPWAMAVSALGGGEVAVSNTKTERSTTKLMGLIAM